LDEEERGRSLVSQPHDAAVQSSSATTSDSASTIKAGKSAYPIAPTMADLTAEEHVSKSIALHEGGALQESTWHLRHAAKQGHPTGMLLYALACRHGWGMRPNPREGVQWLRKAADSASLEIADDEGQAKEGKPVDVVERKTRKAQFALSIYELGVSHMNGWGIEQDKKLALRCFEIAACKFDIPRLAFDLY
jgi:TPR repeat protein